MFLGRSLDIGTPGDSTVTLAKMAANSVDSDAYVDGSIDLAHMSSESVDEDNLHISNSGSNGQFLSKQSGDSGGLTWAAATHTGNVAFPATQVASADANTLDDYEEGTFTAVVSDGTNLMTQSISIGVYTKIGNQVFIFVHILGTSLGSVSGEIRVQGFPFASSSTTNYLQAIPVPNAGSLAITAGTSLGAYFPAGTSYVLLQVMSATTGPAAMQGSNLTANGRLELAGHYII
jgi:hypothetical protein